MNRQRAAERRRYELAMGLKAEHWVPLKASGIAPLHLYRVEGTYQVEFDRCGRTLPIYEYKLIWAKAFEVRHPCGMSHRFATLREAKAFAMQQLAGGQGQ
jgi:hypothetical protein